MPFRCRKWGTGFYNPAPRPRRTEKFVSITQKALDETLHVTHDSIDIGTIFDPDIIVFQIPAHHFLYGCFLRDFLFFDIIKHPDCVVLSYISLKVYTNFRTASAGSIGNRRVWQTGFALFLPLPCMQSTSLSYHERIHNSIKTCRLVCVSKVGSKRVMFPHNYSESPSFMISLYGFT